MEKRSISLVSPDERLKFEVEGTDTVIFYRRLDAKTSNVIRKRFTTTKYVKRQPQEKTDELGLQRATVNHIVLAWESVKLAGEEAPCTDDAVTVGGVEFPYGTKIALPGDILLELLELSGEAGQEAAERSDFFVEKPAAGSSES